MSMKTASLSDSGFTTSAPQKSNIRWFVCFLLFLATTINYMDRSVFSLIEPLLHLPFMGWIPGVDQFHQTVYDINYGSVLICFQIAYGVGFLFAGRIIDKLGTKTGYALAILIWALRLHQPLPRHHRRRLLHRPRLPRPRRVRQLPRRHQGHHRVVPLRRARPGHRPLQLRLQRLRSSSRPSSSPPSPRAGDGTPPSSAPAPWDSIWLRHLAHLSLQQAAPRRHPDPGRPRPRHRRAARSTPSCSAIAASGPSSSARALTDPIWWFYLFYLPKFLNDNYGLDLNHVKYPLIVIYTVATVGSIAGGWLSGFLHESRPQRQLRPQVRHARLRRSACCPSCLFRTCTRSFPHNAWPAIGLFCLATAAHQGWSANLFSTPTDMFPSTSVSTVVGIGGAAGAAGGAVFTWIVSQLFSLHPLLIFIAGGMCLRRLRWPSSSCWFRASA